MTSLFLIKSVLIASALHKTKKKKIGKKAKKSSSPVLKLCRICKYEKGVIPIFNNLLQPDIVEEIKNFSGVSIMKSDNMPDKMCKNCLGLLNGCIMFREMCQKTNKFLSEIVVKKEQNNCGDVKQPSNPDLESDASFNIPSPNFFDNTSEAWECSTCCQYFINLEMYNDHLIRCMEFSEANNGTIEEKSTEDKKKSFFLCDICGKTARSNANLMTHMSTHGNVFPFKCDSCPYQGRTMDLLKVHKRSHLAEKPFKCTQCPKSTTTASNLAKHMRHVHSTNRPYKCTYCEKAFSYQHDMKRHVKDIHLRQGTVECDICFKKFNTKKILHGHRWKIHKIKGERHGRLPSYLQCQEDPGNQLSICNTNPLSYLQSQGDTNNQINICDTTTS